MTTASPHAVKQLGWRWPGKRRNRQADKAIELGEALGMSWWARFEQPLGVALCVGACLLGAPGSAHALKPCPPRGPCERAQGPASEWDLARGLPEGGGSCFDQALCRASADWVAVGRIQKRGQRTLQVMRGGTLHFWNYDLWVKHWEKGGKPGQRRVLLTENWCGQRLPSDPALFKGDFRVYGRHPSVPDGSERATVLALRPLQGGAERGELCAASPAPERAPSSDAGSSDSASADGGATLGDAGLVDAADAAGAGRQLDAASHDAGASSNVPGDASASPAPPATAPSARGCGCRAGKPTSASWSWLVALALLTARRCRSRRGASQLP